MEFTAPRMDGIESRAWLALVATSELLPNALDAQLRGDSGMSHFEFMLLGILNTDDDHTMRMTRLAELTHSTLPRLSKAVTRLEDRGWIERLQCPEDRRATNARLTQGGRRAMILATPGHIETVRRGVLDRLSRTQLAALADALEPILAGLDPDTHFCDRAST